MRAMRMLWRHFLALSLGLLASRAYAQDPAWKAVAAAPQASPPPGAPIASSRPTPPPSAPAPSPAAVIDRPVAIASSRPADHAPPSTPQTTPAPVARGSSPDVAEPAGPLTNTAVYPGLHSWRRADDPITL